MAPNDDWHSRNCDQREVLGNFIGQKIFHQDPIEMSFVENFSNSEWFKVVGYKR